MKNNNSFDINSFISPDCLYAPKYVWVWNDVCTKEIIDSNLNEMLSLGIRSFYILPEPTGFRPDSMPTFLSPDYLTDEFFGLCAYTFGRAEALGMECWIYDEGGWPSGGACGRVMRDHPEFGRQVLKVIKKEYTAGETYRKEDVRIIAAFSNNEELIDEGFIFLRDSVVYEYFTEKEKGSYPDLLNKDATEYFTEITHEKYFSHMKKASVQGVSAVFTDEPKAAANAFNEELQEKYEAEYGESVIPYLPVISGEKKPSSGDVHILHRWYDLLSREFCEKFLLPCKRKANSQGMAFTGHLDKDHHPLGCIRGGGCFNLMRALRCFDIPGIDVIWRQIYPEDRIKEKDDMNAYNGFFPRYASSAARQNGSEFALSEILGVTGAAVSYEIMRYIAGYQAVRGINIFNPFNFPLGRKGVLLAQELPVFTASQPYNEDLAQFNRYLERLSYLSSLGSRVCDTGLYYPVSDFVSSLNAESMAEKFDFLGRRLENLHVDFDIVDDDVIINSVGAENGTISFGNACYTNIIIPEGAYLPEKTKKMLEKFSAGGGRVSYDTEGLKKVIEAEGDGLRVMQRKLGNGSLFFFFCEKGEKGEYTVYLPDEKGYIPDIENGTLQKLSAENGVLRLSLSPGETAVIFLTDESLPSYIKKEYKNSYIVNDGFSLRKKTQLLINEDGFYNVAHTENSFPASLCEWSEYVGKEYSGSCVYETRFSVPKEEIGKEGEISLGEVYFSAKVTLNGKELGTGLSSPYRFKIPSGILDEVNSLKITVINTSANLYTHTDFFDNYKENELSPYFNAEREFARDYVKGGLSGPVTIFI